MIDSKTALEYIKIYVYNGLETLYDPRARVFIDEPCWACKKSMLIVAEPGQSLQCFKCGARMAIHYASFARMESPK